MMFGKKNLFVLALLVTSISYAEDFNISQETKKESKEILKHTKDDNSKLGSFAVTGNAIVFQRDGSLINNGFLKGSISAVGEDTKEDKSKKGEIVVTAQGNGVSSVGYSPYSNKRDVDKKINSIKNNGYISGETNLTGGNAETHGALEEVYSVANGISGLTLADFGDSATGGSGDTGRVDGVGGASRSRSKSVRLLENKVGEIKKTDPADFHGKNNKFTLEDIVNIGNISGKAILRTKEGYVKPDSEAFGGNMAMSPQWRTINVTSIANGIANMAYITTIDKYTYSEDKVNGSYIKSVNNSGNISGEADAKTGSLATLNNIRAYATANGISSVAYSNNFVKSLTEATIDKVNNSGNISGKLKAEVGHNTSRGIHEYSQALVTGSANGISVYSRSSNGQMKNSRAVLGELTNTGSISGDLFAVGGSGYGEARADIKSSGNGVAVYTESSVKKETKIGSIDNKGMITGKAVIYGGKDKRAMDDKELKDKIFHVPLTNNISGFSLPDEDVEDDKAAVAEMRKYEKEKANELINNIAKYEKLVEDKEKEILEAKRNSIPTSVLKEGGEYYLNKVSKDIEEKNKKIKENERRAGMYFTSEKRKKELLEENKQLASELSILEEIQKKYKDNPEKLPEALDTYNSLVASLEKEVEEDKKFIAKYEDQGYMKYQVDARKLKLKENEEKLALKKKALDIVSPEVDKLNLEKEKLGQDLANLLKEKKDIENDHIAANVNTVTGMEASGNGISINDGSQKGVQLGSFKNSGVISGETEIHHGHSQRKYTRIAHKNSGAGVAIGGDTDTKIENTGIISGTEFALLAKGNRSDAYGLKKEDIIYESGFKGGVDNYGILAGRIIIGGYQVAHTGTHGEWGAIEEDYAYFETIYRDEKHYNNKGIFLVLDRDGEVKKVIGKDEDATHNGKTVKNVLDKDGTYIGDTTNKIINGVGKDGVVVAKENQNRNIDNSIVNGFKTTVKVEDKGVARISNSTINANGFGNSYAILGDEGTNKVEITGKSIINGKIDLGAGDDTLTISGDSKLNREVDLGTGNNTLSFGKRENGTRTLSYSTFSTSTAPMFTGVVANANKVEVNEDIALSSNSRVSGVNELDVASGKTLDYYFAGKENQAFADLVGSNRILKVNGNGKINLVPIGDKVQIGYEKDLLGFTFGTNSNSQNNGGNNTPGNNNPGNSGNNGNNNTPGNNIPGNNGGFFIDPRLTPFEKYSKGAFDAYITDYMATGIDFLKDYKSSQDVFKSYLYNLTNNNTVGYLKDSAIDTMLAYHKTNTNNFAKKGQLAVSGETFNVRNKYYENNKVVSNGALAEISYGMSDNTNIGLNIGGGQSKIKTSDENLKSEVFVLGVNADYKVNNFSWENSISYGRIKPKKHSSLDTYSLYSQLGYSIQLGETWSLIPKVSVFLSKVKQKEMIANNIKVVKDDDTFVETAIGTELNKKFIFGSNGLTLGLGVDYSMVKDLDNSKAHFVGGSTEFELRNYDRKNRATAEIKLGYEHISGITATLRFRKNKDITSSGFGIGYKF